MDGNSLELRPGYFNKHLVTISMSQFHPRGQSQEFCQHLFFKLQVFQLSFPFERTQVDTIR